ncbi:MAG TPA: CYTH and CHAD domain-containing protein [Gaiellaceae bacterium]
MEVTAEYERKLDAPEGFELPDLGGDPLEPRVFTSIYHDTADGSLARAGITLRRRTERGRSVWQLKLPAADSRLELEQAGGPGEPPVELGRLLTAHLRHGGLAPVAELRTRRHGSLVARNGTTAEVTVDEVAVMDALRVTDEFVEVEIELRSGDPKHLDRLVGEVAGAGAHPTDGTPKLFRALGLERDRARPPRDPFKALRSLLRRQLGEILAHDPGTRLGTDPESLHDMRVAVRRSRALLRAGGTLTGTDTAVLASELRWLGEVLGSVRDLDVLLERLREEAALLDPADRAAAGRLLRALERARTRARKTLLKMLDDDRYLRLLDRFEEAVAGMEPGASTTTLDALARRQLKKLARAAQALGDEPVDAQLHELRKLCKRTRYAFELAGNDRVVRRAKALQEVLGAHQDAVVAEAQLRTLAANAPPAQALAAGLLICGERRRRDGARATWRKAWKQLERTAA